MTMTVIPRKSVDRNVVTAASNILFVNNVVSIYFGPNIILQFKAFITDKDGCLYIYHGVLAFYRG